MSNSGNSTPNHFSGVICGPSESEWRCHSSSICELPPPPRLGARPAHSHSSPAAARLCSDRLRGKLVTFPVRSFSAHAGRGDDDTSASLRDSSSPEFRFQPEIMGCLSFASLARALSLAGSLAAHLSAAHNACPAINRRDGSERLAAQAESGDQVEHCKASAD